MELCFCTVLMIYAHGLTEGCFGGNPQVDPMGNLWELPIVIKMGR